MHEHPPRVRTPIRRRMIRWAIILGVLAVGVWIFFRWFERANVYQPTRTWWSSGDELRVRWEAITFDTADGVRLSAWFFPARTNAAFPDIAFVLSHGNGGNVSHRLSLYRTLLDLGVNVLAYDYRGFGQSAGSPDEAGTYRDAEAAVDWLKSRGFPENRIVAHGESLGGGIASELALRRPGLRGLVLQSTFTSIPDLGVELFPWLPVRTLARIHYDTHAKLPRVRVPLLVLHSRADTLIPFAHAERNFAAANAPKLLREIAGDHNEQPDRHPEIFTAALREFLGAR